MEHKYKFSIIIPHYDGTITDAVISEGLASLYSQKYQNFEIILIHDGPTSRPLPEIKKDHKIKVTNKRYNDYGHSLRDLGMRMASGEYIVHFNPDNILYPDLLEKIEYTSRIWDLDDTKNDIILYSIYLAGRWYDGYRLRRDKNKLNTKIILTGYPVGIGHIDCMQLVAKRSVWLKENFWECKEKNSDGIMYPILVKKYGARHIGGEPLGEHR